MSLLIGSGLAVLAYDRIIRGAVMGSDSPKGMVIGLAPARG